MASPLCPGGVSWSQCVPGPVHHLSPRLPQLLPLDGELVLASGAAFSAAGGDSDPACDPGETGGRGSWAGRGERRAERGSAGRCAPAQAPRCSSAIPTASRGSTHTCGARGPRRAASSPWTPSACPAATTTSSSRVMGLSAWRSAQAPPGCTSAASRPWAR